LGRLGRARHGRGRRPVDRATGRSTVDNRGGTAMIWLLPGVLAVLLGHTVVNRLLLRSPSAPAPMGARQALAPVPIGAAGAALVPARDEASRVRATVRSLLDQRDVPGLRVVVLDDGSTDGTADAVRAEGAGDPRLRVLTGAPLPEGWLGKPYACDQLA